MMTVLMPLHDRRKIVAAPGALRTIIPITQTQLSKSQPEHRNYSDEVLTGKRNRQALWLTVRPAFSSRPRMRLRLKQLVLQKAVWTICRAGYEWADVTLTAGNV